MQYAMLGDLTKVSILKDENKLALPSKPQQQITWAILPLQFYPEALNSVVAILDHSERCPISGGRGYTATTNNFHHFLQQ